MDQTESTTGGRVEAVVEPRDDEEVRGVDKGVVIIG